MNKNAKPAHAINGVPAAGYYGSPITGQRHAPTATSRPAPSYAPFVGRNRCVANDDTCEAPRAKGTDYCVGHLRSRAKNNGN
jgi:hypothetical protein